MKTIKISVCIFLLACLASCVGTDFLDDPIVGEKIIIASNTLALLPSEKFQATAEYFDKYGVKQNVTLLWQSSNPTIADVNATGLVTGKTPGQALVQPYLGDFLGPQIQVTVVSDPSSVASVEIKRPTSLTLSLGTKVQLEVVVKNVAGTILLEKSIEWFSENSNILTVNSTGLVEAIGSGIAGIHAKVNGVKSNIIDFDVTGFLRKANFNQAGGYIAKGSATLEQVKNTGAITLSLSADFDTDFALGTFIYLANSTNGSTVRSNGLELGQIFKDGAATFSVSSIKPTVTLNEYRYVIILCKPASVTFGFADLK
jgi:uncharacterized protein YjdB